MTLMTIFMVMGSTVRHFRTIYFSSGGILIDCSQPSSFYFDFDANYFF